ncbi:hypothetical protein HYH03_000534 [Edaphochlamys debaryana]|uniref:Uncharacterized protein n=1 Tax=Edaphochlamys debaryana TaxID=47281 RepID=A0A835YP69_9CHLO|nr:hypothetical protein HYH03_000534 [Edaphochlamys debaryana]|eukprot:KAG2502040.1 hypothetical protein HYH03_000534 [Edaphochlamys debaryana]
MAQPTGLTRRQRVRASGPSTFRSPLNPPSSARSAGITAATMAAPVTVRFEPVALGADAQPSLPRSGACAAALPSWHPHEAIMLTGYTEDASAGGTPPRLTSQAAVVGDELVLVAGWNPAAAAGAPDPSVQFLNDVWALDLRTWRWRQVAPAGPEELPRISRFAMTPLPGGPGRLLLHTHRSAEDVLVLEPAASPPALGKVPVRGVSPDAPSPPSRGLHSLTAASAPEGASGSALYVFGGAPQSGPMFGDLWALDPAAMTWQELRPEGPAPHARCSHVAAAACSGRYLVAHGGSFYEQPGKLQPLDDVVVYDTQAKRWLEAKVEGPRPRARNAHVMVPLRPAAGSAADRFLLHGGWRPFVESYNDSFIVTVEAGGAAA